MADERERDRERERERDRQREREREREKEGAYNIQYLVVLFFQQNNQLSGPVFLSSFLTELQKRIIVTYIHGVKN